VLLRNGVPVAPLLVAETAVARGKGLLGTSAVEGALWLEPCPSVHMLAMTYPIDAATLRADGVVLDIRTLAPWVGLTRPRRGARITVEAAAGFFAGHLISVGDRLEIGRR